jgi:hypothetical protein
LRRFFPIPPILNNYALKRSGRRIPLSAGIEVEATGGHKWLTLDWAVGTGAKEVVDTRTTFLLASSPAFHVVVRPHYVVDVSADRPSPGFHGVVSSYQVVELPADRLKLRVDV